MPLSAWIKEREKNISKGTSMYQISFYVPKSHTELVKKAMFDAGAGSTNNSNYTNCSWQIEGEGQYMPTQKANPFIGKLDQLETIPEHKVEMVCNSEYIDEAISALKNTHPYDEIAYCVTKMEAI